MLIIRVFKKNGEPLSEESKISKINQKKWEIVDGNNKYKIEEIKTELNIYKCS